MLVEIDPSAGFCFGVDQSIALAEEYLKHTKKLYCLGALVHNEEETTRLASMGLEVIDIERFKELRDETVLLRAHGEPPSTYEIARAHNLILIDATCPIVKRLQNKVSCSYDELLNEGGQVVVFGSEKHPEVIGLTGQAPKGAIVVNSPDDLHKIDFTRKVHLYSQTTKNQEDYFNIQEEIKKRMKEANILPGKMLSISHSICRQVSHRVPEIRYFATEHQVVVFVAGKESSNGKVLFKVAHEQNNRTHFVSSPEEIEKDWFEKSDKVGVTGATSTPGWLLQQVAERIRSI